MAKWINLGLEVQGSDFDGHIILSTAYLEFCIDIPINRNRKFSEMSERFSVKVSFWRKNAKSDNGHNISFFNIA